jgi:hypothetical protein
MNAASGLELHRSALSFRVLLIVVAIIYVLVRLASDTTPAEPGGFGLLLGVAEVASTIAALVGVSRFVANLPSENRGLGGVATVCLLVTIGTSLWALWVTWQVMELVARAKHATSFWNMPSMDILDKAERLPTVQTVGAITGLLALLIVLLTIAGVGRTLAKPYLASTARGLMVAVVVLAVA